ncbi:MAG: diguanylate cyclase [Burkholderiales bacterium]
MLSESFREGLLGLIELSPVPIYVLDDDGRVVLWNPAAVTLFGWEATEVVGKLLPTLHTVRHHALRSSLEALRTAGGIDCREIEHHAKDGRPMTIRVAAARAWKINEEQTGTVVIAEDITERKRAESALRESEAQLRSIFDSAGDAIIVFDELGAIESFNPACVRIFGYKSDALRGQNVRMLIPHVSSLHEELGLSAGGKSGARGLFTGPMEVVARRNGGHSFAVEVSLSEMMTAAGRRFAGTFRDIAIRKRVEESARRLNEELSLTITELEEVNRENRVLSEMRDMLQTCHSVEEVYLVAQQFVVKLMTDVTGALYMLDARNELLEAVVGWGNPSMQDAVFGPDACWALRRGRPYLVADPGGSLSCKHLTTVAEHGYVCVPLTAQGDTLGMLHLQPGTCAIADDQRVAEKVERLAATLSEHISLAVANVRLRESLRMQATKDGLTGLFNRRFMEEILERELRRALRKNRQLAVFMVDIDHFKRINDLFGHEVGDLVLREVAECLRANIRQEDFACRYGGEEFVLVLPESDIEALMPRATTILDAIGRLVVTHHGQPIGQVTVSIGMAAAPQHGNNVLDLVRAADQALYRAKNDGRNQAVLSELLNADEMTSG